MSQEAVEQVLGRLITDEKFRTQVGVSLEKASLQQGYALTAAEIRLLSGLDLLGFSGLAHRLNPGLCRAGR